MFVKGKVIILVLNWRFYLSTYYIHTTFGVLWSPFMKLKPKVIDFLGKERINISWSPFLVTWFWFLWPQNEGQNGGNINNTLEPLRTVKKCEFARVDVLQPLSDLLEVLGISGV